MALIDCPDCGRRVSDKASSSKGYLCVACEEQALVTSARRRVLLQWWPVALIALLISCAAAGTSWAVAQNKPPHDPVTPGEH
jgi:hypothetical protein